MTDPTTAATRDPTTADDLPPTSRQPAGSAARAASSPSPASAASAGSRPARRRPRSRSSWSTVDLRRRTAATRRALPAAAGLLRRAAGAARPRARRELGRTRTSATRARLRRACTTARRWRCWLRAVRRRAADRAGAAARSTGCPATTSTSTRTRRCSPASSRNSSVAFGEDALMKVFRKVTPGVNPDIAIHEVLTEAGSDHVAALYGWLETDGADDGADAAPAGDAPAVPAHRQRRLGRSRWPASATCSPRPTCTPTRSAATSPARPPGSASRPRRCTTTLAEHFPTDVRTADDLAGWPTRCRAGSRPRWTSCPSWRRTPSGLRDAFDAAAADPPACRVQRVHGDLHLGQTLRTVAGLEDRRLRGRAGQAARRAGPARLRAGATSPGMLRSFDYAPRVAERRPTAGPTTPARSRSPSGRRSGPSATARRSCAATPRPRADRRRADAARALHRRQGRLRGGLRSPQPADLAADPAGRDRAPVG